MCIALRPVVSESACCVAARPAASRVRRRRAPAPKGDIVCGTWLTGDGGSASGGKTLDISADQSPQTSVGHSPNHGFTPLAQIGGGPFPRAIPCSALVSYQPTLMRGSVPVGQSTPPPIAQARACPGHGGGVERLLSGPPGFVVLNAGLGGCDALVEGEGGSVMSASVRSGHHCSVPHIPAPCGLL